MENKKEEVVVKTSRKFQSIVFEMLFLRTILDATELSDKERVILNKKYDKLKSKLSKEFCKINKDNLEEIKEQFIILMNENEKR